MSELIWYVYQAKTQVGPFSGDQVKQMLTINMIALDAFLFKVGWKDWRPIEETYAEFGLKAPETGLPDRKAGAPRATISGRVIVHNNGQVVIGSGINISATGIFIETKDEIFNLGEQLKLSVKIDRFDKPFNVTAEVIRFNNDPKYPTGYGLQFLDIEEEVKEEVQELVNSQAAV